MFFKANTNISSTDVEKTIEEAATCESCPLAGGTFNGTSLCDQKPCELKTSTCESKSGSFGCNCLPGYIKTNFSNRMCIACPSGEKAVGFETCIDCSFGQSGFNCNESWQLALVIVGTVLGGLLLITLILLPVLLHKKSSKKSSKKNNKSDTEKSYNSHLPAKAPLVNNGLANSQAASVNGPANSLSAFANAGVPRIPRATSTNSWDSRTNLEMAPSNGRQNLIPMGKNPRLYDDHEYMNPYAQARPQSSLYAQARPQNNPYAQNRPQTNPYDQSQGHSNPHYVHDNGRRFN
ncbi:protein HEG homolog 1-like [Sebastes umbrosus]|uniref:protein HEG homolog 1-like n=1 Tax=Sebastes umbrosus TaxID=72105 RepID=UPI00189EC17E|nr:protein HEG homolog 1-like [Sebastes umbrosus]